MPHLGSKMTSIHAATEAYAVPGTILKGIATLADYMSRDLPIHPDLPSTTQPVPWRHKAVPHKGLVHNLPIPNWKHGEPQPRTIIVLTKLVVVMTTTQAQLLAGSHSPTSCISF
jgi:hypothetical protein